MTPEDSYEDVQKKVRAAIENHFKFTLNRPEILNRIGENIVVFDFIRPETAEQILRSQIERIVKNLEQEKRIRLEITDSAYEKLKARALENLSNGGRGIGNIVESLLINPLSRYLFDEEIRGDVRLTINDISPEGAVAETAAAKTAEEETAEAETESDIP